MTDSPSLRTRLRAANKRCALFPEQSHNPDGTVTVKADAFLAFLELRNLSTELNSALLELEKLREEQAKWVTVPRME